MAGMNSHGSCWILVIEPDLTHQRSRSLQGTATCCAYVAALLAGWSGTYASSGRPEQALGPEKPTTTSRYSICEQVQRAVTVCGCATDLPLQTTEDWSEERQGGTREGISASGSTSTRDRGQRSNACTERSQER